jgi:hypothetical protein
MGSSTSTAASSAEETGLTVIVLVTRVGLAYCSA